MKRFLAILLSLCLLLSMTPGFADNGNNGNHYGQQKNQDKGNNGNHYGQNKNGNNGNHYGQNKNFWDHDLHRDELGKDLYARIWEAFRIDMEDGMPLEYDEEQMRALLEKIIAGEELTEEETALQGSISPIGLALLVSYTLTPPQPEQVAAIYTALDSYVEKAEKRQISEIPEEEIESVYIALGDLCAVSGVQMVLTPVSEGAKTSYITLIDPEIVESGHEVSSLLYCEVPAKKMAEVVEIVEVIRAEQGEEAVEQIKQIAASDMTDEEAEQQL